MNSKTWKFGLWMVFVAMAFVLTGSGSLAVASEIEIEGTVTADYQILTDDDELYEIGETDKGEELMDYVDQRVRLIGAVEEGDDGTKVLQVTSFQLLDE